MIGQRKIDCSVGPIPSHYEASVTSTAGADFKNEKSR
jgi:hypothetical protein